MKSKLIIVATAVILIITVIFLYYLHSSSEKEFVQRFQAQQLVAARTLAREIESYLHDRSRGVEVLSTFSVLQYRDLNKIAATIEEYFEYVKKDHVKAISVYDEKGTIIYSTNKAVIGLNYSETDFFKWAVKKENKGKQFVSSLIRKTDDQTVRLPNFRFLIAVPIYQETEKPQYPKPSKKFVGIVTATIDLEEVLAAFLPIASPYAAKEKVWIMDRDGTLLFQSEHPEMALRNIRLQDKTCFKCHVTFEHVETILNERQGTTEYQLKDIPKKLAGYSSIEFKNISWTIVLDIPFEEVSGFINKNLMLTFILIGVITLTLIGGSSLIYRSNRLKIRSEEEVKYWKEKRELENQIRGSEEKFRLIAESSIAGIYLIQDNLFLYVSPSFENIFGYRIDEIIGKLGPFDLTYPDDRDTVAANIRRRIEGEVEQIHYEFRGMQKDGSVINVEVHGSRIDYQGKPAVIGTLIDITERKRAEEQIKRLNHIYIVLSNINQAIVRIHEREQLFIEACRIAVDDGKFRMAWIGMVNSQTQKVEAVASAGLINDYLDKIDIDLSSEKRSKGPTGRAIQSGTHFIVNDIENDDTMIPWKEDAKRLSFRSSASFPLKVFGKTTGCFNLYSSEVGFFDEDEIKLLDELATDISFALEFMEREAQRKQAEEALQESEEGFRRLFEESTDPILLLNQKCFFDCNPATLSILQLKSKDEIGNKTPWDLSPEFQPDGKLSSEKAVEMISTAKQNGFHRFEWVHTKKDGSNFFVEVILTPILLHGEEIFHVIWRDITERKRAEEKLKNRLEFENLISNISSNFINLHSDILDSAINEALGKIGRFASVDRSYLFLFSEDGSYMDNTHEWCAEGIEPQIDNLKELPVTLFPWWMAKLNNFETIHIPRVADLSDEANAEKEILESQDIKSVVVIPMISANTLLGFLGFDSVSQEKIWADEDILLLKTLSEIFISALERIKFETTLRENEQKLRNIFEHSTNLFYSHDTNHVLNYLSPQIKDILGYEVEEALIKWTELASDNSINEIGFQKTSKAIETGEAQEPFELELVHKNGRKVRVEVREAPVVKNGKTVAIVGSLNDITERKRAEEELKISHKTYLGIINSLTEAIYIQDENGVFLEVNKAAEMFYGYPKEYFIGKTPGLISAPGKNDIPMIAEAIKKAFNGEPQSFEFWGLRKNGTIFPKSVNLTSGEYFGKKVVIATARDITERKRAEEVLQESEERFRNIVENIDEVFYVSDGQGKIFYCSPNITTATGYSLQEIIGKSFLRLVAPIDRRILLDYYLEQTTKGVSDTALVFRVRCKDGKMIWVEQITHIVRDTFGNVVEYRNVARDITERKHAEEEIISQRNKFVQLFENSPIAIALLDDQDKVVHINESFSALFGYYLEEIKGQELNDIIVPTELKEEAESYSDQTREGNQINKESYRKKKDGTLVYVQIIGVPVNINDKTVGIYGMYVDLTQRKDAEEKMKIAKELAEQSDKLKSEFLAQMSHEIRTPINIISGNVDYLNQSFGENMDADTRDCFDGMELASKRIIRTIDLILNVAELQTSGYKPQFVKIDLDSGVLGKLYREHQRSAKQKGLELIYKCEAKGSEITADEYSITQIFTNLIDNAIKFTKKGKVEILFKNDNAGKIMVEVKDTGIGISKEFLPKIFEPFVQEEQGYTRSFEGNGLGLALVKRYCDINNAVIEVESEKNVGSTFRVIFSRE